MADKSQLSSARSISRAYTLPHYKQKILIPPRPNHPDHRAEREYILQLKAIIFQLEAENRHYLFFYHRQRQWWQMGGNSALFYFHHISNQIGTKPNLKNDTDYGDFRWRTGVIAFNRVENILDKLSGIDLKPTVTDKEFIAIPLASTYSEVDIKSLQNIEDQKERRFNAMMLPDNILPGTRSACDQLHKTIIDKVVNLDPPKRQYYGDDGVRLSKWISYNFISMCNGHYDPEEYFITAIDKLEELTDWIVYVKKFNIFNSDTNLRLADGILDLKSRMENELKEYKRHLANDLATNSKPTQSSLFKGDKYADKKRK